MKRFYQLLWDDWNLEHIGRHNVIPEEVEEAVFSSSTRIRHGRATSLYYLFGQASAGRYLFIVVRDCGYGQVKPITARDMSHAERRIYRNML